MKQHYTEAKLVSLLEKKGIGRPSTFSSIITKIQERDYVNKSDVKGKMINCVDFVLMDDEIEEIEHTKTVGNERNKMLITPTGMVVIEFLLEYFDEIFKYEYTKNMEDILDIIARGNKKWYTLCQECNQQISDILSTIDGELQQNFEIDEDHTYMIGRYGPVIKTKVDGKTKFLKVKDSITFSDITSGKFTVDEMIDKKHATRNDPIGMYKGDEILIKDGKFGVYALVNKKTYSLKHLGKERSEITEQEVIDVIENKNPANKSILRTVNEYISIRNGKFGKYIFYKKETMKKPKFFTLKGFELDPLTCKNNILEKWIYETHLFM